MFVDERMSPDAVDGPSIKGIAQVMNNSAATWAKCYNLRKIRDGQHSLDVGMPRWRESMDALLMASAGDAAAELIVTAPIDLAASEDEDIVIVLSSDSDSEEDHTESHA